MNSLNRKAVFIACLLSTAFMGTAAQAASFDCYRAASPTEVAICSDPELSRLDEVMLESYREAMSAAPEIRDVQRTQREWIGERDICGEDRDCLAAAYHDRLADLDSVRRGSLPDPEIVSEPAPLADEQPTARADEQPTSVAERSSSGVVGAPSKGEQAGAPALAQLALGGILIGLLAVMAICLLATKWVADHSARKYGWRMIVNGWNLLYLVGAIGAVFAFSVGAPLGAAVVFAAIWLVMLMINVRKTSFGFGLIMTLMQPFVIFVAFMAIQLTRVMLQPPKRHPVS